MRNHPSLCLPFRKRPIDFPRNRNMNATWRSHALGAERPPGRETSLFLFLGRLLCKPVLLSILSLTLAGCAHQGQDNCYVHQQVRRPLFHPTDEQKSRRRELARDVAITGLYGAALSAY